MLEAILLLNAIWFGLGFQAFYIRRAGFTKVLVPNRAQRDNAAYEALIETGRFMGGFNFALAVLNVFLLFNLAGFDKDSQWATLLVFNALAHGSQFAGNIPMALKNRRGDGLWNVFEGVMLRIFVIDFVLAVFNAGVALAVLM